MPDAPVVLINLLRVKPGKQDAPTALLNENIDTVICTLHGLKVARLVGQPNHRDPGFPVRARYARVRALGAARLARRPRHARRPKHAAVGRRADVIPVSSQSAETLPHAVRQV